MRIPITVTYTLAALTVAALVLALSLWATRVFFERDFANYVFEGERHQLAIMARELADHYAQEGSWDFVRANPRVWLEVAGFNRLRRDQRHRRGNTPTTEKPPTQMRLPPPGNLVLMDADHKVLWGREPRNPKLTGSQLEQPIIVDNGVNTAIVGYLQNRSVQRISGDVDQAFSTSQRTAVIVVGLCGLLLASIFAFLMARRMVAPIKQIQAHTQKLQQARYEETLKLASDDELGDLAASLNDLGATLQANRTARQQWLANISHELRTPLAIVKGEIEALQDNVRPLTAEAINSLATEVEHLQYLIHDLNELTLSDLGALTYAKAPLDLAVIIAEVIESQRMQIEAAGASVTFNAAPGDAWVMGDAHRLRQLFSNLLDNALKYSDRPATVTVSCTIKDNMIACSICDSPPGIEPHELEQVFEPLFRTDKARTGRSSGLGLAICRNLASAHHATIEAQPSPLGGLQILLTFPALSKP